MDPGIHGKYGQTALTVVVMEPEREKERATLVFMVEPTVQGPQMKLNIVSWKAVQVRYSWFADVIKEIYYFKKLSFLPFLILKVKGSHRLSFQ